MKILWKIVKKLWFWFWFLRRLVFIAAIAGAAILIYRQFVL